MNPAFHSITVGLHSGILVFATLGILIRTWLWLKGRNDGPVAVASDLMALIAAVVGALFVVASSITGILIWPLPAMLNSPLVRNKILLSVIVLLLWLAFILTRTSQRSRLWKDPALTVVYVVIGLAGIGAMFFTNAFGGALAGKPSGATDLLRLIGVEPYFTFYLPTWLNLLMVALAVLLVVAAHTVFAGRSSRRNHEA